VFVRFDDYHGKKLITRDVPIPRVKRSAPHPNKKINFSFEQFPLELGFAGTVTTFLINTVLEHYLT
jgi:hypothetical protein